MRTLRSRSLVAIATIFVGLFASACKNSPNDRTPELCAAQTTCNACAGTVGCGYCGATKKCMFGKADGPTEGMCATEWTWATAMCPAEEAGVVTDTGRPDTGPTDTGARDASDQ